MHLSGILFKSFFQLSLRVALNLWRIVSFVYSLGMSISSMVSFSSSRNIYCLYQLKPSKKSEWIFFFPSSSVVRSWTDCKLIFRAQWELFWHSPISLMKLCTRTERKTFQRLVGLNLEHRNLLIPILVQEFSDIKKQVKDNGVG